MTSELQSQNRVRRLARMTLGYSREEDRVRLDGEDDDGETITFWLTARLLSALVRYLARQQENLIVTPNSQEGDEGHSKSTIVRCDDKSPQVLITAVDLSATEEHIKLMLKDNTGSEVAGFALSAHALRLWVQGVRNCFEQAGWPQAVFLQGFDATKDDGPEGITIH